jgi:hypothetical protein
MKRSTIALGLLLLLGSTGLASAREIVRASGPAIQASFSLPGMRLVFGRPNVYCRYQGRYYDRMAWERFVRYHRARMASYRHDRDFDRDYRGYDRDHGFDRDQRHSDRYDHRF